MLSANAAQTKKQPPMKAATLTVHLLRHGECDDSAFLRGTLDSALSQTGWQQMQAQWQALAADLADSASSFSVISSPKQRCLAFAQSVSNQVVVDAAWQERHFGEWDGLSFADLERLAGDDLAQYFKNPLHFAIPKAELLAEFEAKIYQAWWILVEKQLKKSLKNAVNESFDHACSTTENHAQVVIFTHGGVMRVLLKHLLQLNEHSLFNWQVGYAARLSFEITACTNDNAATLLGDERDHYFCKLLELVQPPKRPPRLSQQAASPTELTNKAGK